MARQAQVVERGDGRPGSEREAEVAQPRHLSRVADPADDRLHAGGRDQPDHPVDEGLQARVGAAVRAERAPRPGRAG